MRILHLAMGSAIALALVGPASADDPDRDDQTRQDRPRQLNDPNRRDDPQERNDAKRQEPPSMQNRTDVPAADGQARPDPKASPDPGATGSSADYSAELKKCDPLAVVERTKCIESVKKKFGQL